MSNPDDTPPEGPEPFRPRPGNARPVPPGDPSLADYREALDRSLAELDRALEAELPVPLEELGSDDFVEAVTAGRHSVGRRRENADEWDRPAVLPYLTATALALVAMTLLVTSTALPAAGVFQVGLTFLAIAMVVRRLEDAPRDTGNPVLDWLTDRAVQLEGKFGVGFYGVAALTSFLRAEVNLVGDLSLGGILSDPIGTAVSLFVSALIESIMNAVWAALWWVELMSVVDGLPLLAGIVGAGWLVWRVLDITPAPEDG